MKAYFILAFFVLIYDHYQVHTADITDILPGFADPCHWPFLENSMDMSELLHRLNNVFDQHGITVVSCAETNTP